MQKSIEFTRAPTYIRATKPRRVSEDLASNIATQINNFIDKFESDKEYPQAIVALRHGSPIKKKRRHIREAIIENEPLDKERRTHLHRAVLKNDRRWLRLVCCEVLDKELLDADIYGKTPLHYAAENEQLNELLNQRNAVASLLQIPDAEGNTALHIMALVKRFDKSIVALVRSSELKFLLHIKNTQNQSVLDIIKNNADMPLFAYLTSRFEKINSAIDK